MKPLRRRVGILIAVLLVFVVVFGLRSFPPTAHATSGSPGHLSRARDALATHDAAKQRERLLQEAIHLLDSIERVDNHINRVIRVASKLEQHQQQLEEGDAASPETVSGDESDQTPDTKRAADFPLQRLNELRGKAANRDHERSIFIGMVSHRNKKCAAVLSNVFQHAEKPERVHVGLVQVRHEKEDPMCLPPELTDCQLDAFCITDHVRIRDLEPHDDRGESYGRYVAGLLYRGQDYMMFVSLPSFVAPSWDTSLVVMHRKALEHATQQRQSSSTPPEVVLSTIPEDANPDARYPVLPYRKQAFTPEQPATPKSSVTSPLADLPLATLPKAARMVVRDEAAAASEMVWDRQTTTRLCRATFADRSSRGPLGVPHFAPTVMRARDIPSYQPWASTAFVFGNASTFTRLVPVDPHLLFTEHHTEEDALLSARLWASGVDIYAPSRTVVFGWNQGNETAPRMASDVPSAQYVKGRQTTFQRIQFFLHALQPGTYDPIVSDDEVSPDAIQDAAHFGVMWHGSTPTDEYVYVPPRKRNLEQWYRHSGLNPSAAVQSREAAWCSEDGKGRRP